MNLRQGVESGVLALTVTIAPMALSSAPDLSAETAEADHGDHEGPDA